MEKIKFYFEKYIRKDPLADLFASDDFIEGYKAGQSFEAQRGKREMQKILLATKDDSAKYGIFSGNIRVGKLFDTAFLAYKKAYEERQRTTKNTRSHESS